MKIALEASGRAVQWQLIGAQDVEAWMEAGPWDGLGGVQVVRVPRVERDEVLESVERSFRALERDRVRWSELEPDPGRGPLEALRAWLGVRGMRDRQVLQRLAEDSRDQPRLFVAHAPAGEALRWRDEARALAELVSKLADRGSLSLLVLSERDLEGVPRLDLAWPAPPRWRRGEPDLWAAYVHERLAWHTGGDLDEVIAALRRLGALDVGDDAALERCLSEHARERWRSLDGGLREALRRSLAPLRYSPELTLNPGIPGAGGASKPAPWLARALLHLEPEHPAGRVLLSSVACRSLAMRLLGRCMDIEALLKDAYLDRLVGPPPYEVVARYEQLVHQPGSLGRQLRPPDELLPRSAWDIAGLGALAHRAPLSGRERKLVHAVRETRNALAHGSSVGWRGVQHVERLEARAMSL